MRTFAEANTVLSQFWLDQPSHLELSSLESMTKLMAFLGNPQNKLKVIHVAGTSGKSSTAYYAAALLKSTGKKVGLTVSPHVDEVNERVQINLAPMPEREFCRELALFLQLVKKSGVRVSYFSVLAAFALWEFERQSVEYAVVEVGVGGTTDATNCINHPGKVCVITDIGADHLSKLGPTLADVAGHKAGIIQLSNSVYCYRQAPEIMKSIVSRAQRMQAELHVQYEDIAETDLEFLPIFQQRNLGLARAAVNGLLAQDEQSELTDEVVQQAAQTYIPGRMEVVEYQGRKIILDVAHNSPKLHALVETIRRDHRGQKIAAVVSLVRSSDYRLEGSAEELAPVLKHAIITSFSGPQDGPHSSTDSARLAEIFTQEGAESVQIIDDPEAALEALLKRPEPVLLVTGSFFLLNHIRPLLSKG